MDTYPLEAKGIDCVDSLVAWVGSSIGRTVVLSLGAGVSVVVAVGGGVVGKEWRSLLWKPAPIIVVMGDHGPSTRRRITKEMRMATLNAYLVNDVAKAQLYPSVTPIN
jgi:hypothetical protein